KKAMCPLYSLVASRNYVGLFAFLTPLTPMQVFFSFLIHTSAFTVLALIVTPIVRLYLPRYVPQMVPMRRRPKLRTSGLRPAVAVDWPAQFAFRSSYQEAIERTFASQYVAGVSYMVT